MTHQKPTLTLRAATLDDVPALTDVYFDAFLESTISKLCFPPEHAESLAYWEGRIRASLSMPGTHVVVASWAAAGAGADASEPGRIVGWARWVRKPVAVTASPAEPPLTADMFPACGDGDLAARFFGAAASATHRLVAGKEIWMLSMIATRRETQRKGVGSALMKYGVDLMDQEGWMGYVNASPEGRLLYERFGFQVIDEIWFDEVQHSIFHMRRDAKVKCVSSA